MSLISIIFALVLSLSTSVAFAEDAPPAQFTIPFVWQHPCTVDGFGLVRNPDQVPAYKARDDTGRWYVSAGFSTDSERSCNEEQQIEFTETGRLPAAVEALKDKGWPVDDPAVVYVNQQAIAGEAVVTVTWVPSSPPAPLAPEAPPAPTISTERGEDGGRIGTWFLVNNKRQTFVPDGETGAAGAAGVTGTTGAWAFESFSVAAGPTFLLPNPEFFGEDHLQLAVMAEVTFEIHISEKVLGALVSRFGGPSEWLGYEYTSFDPSFGVAAEVRLMPWSWMWFGAGGGYDAYGVYKASSDGDWYSRLDNAGGRASIGVIPWSKRSSLTLSLNAQGGLGSNPARFAGQVGWRWGSPDDSK